ncbi:FAD-dependent oxidoreductase [Candidatus Bathyarchaeota archaeon]|nr:FAD-dependent oxidoreductase [Candidatus Bathyarchaeota archaeon]
MGSLVILDTFGETLKEKLDVDSIEEYAKKQENVLVTYQTHRLNQNIMSELIREVQEKNGIDSLSNVIVLTGSRVRLEIPLKKAMESAGLDPNLLVMSNIREQAALVHNFSEATEKAKALLRIALVKAKNATPVERKVIQRFNEVLIIGGGVAGIHAALDLAKLGLMVHLVEREPTIGGLMPLLGKTFPEDTCAICIGGPKMADVGNEPNIEILDYSEVEAIIRLPVGYRVHIKRKPRYIDPEKCVACGQCTERCPVSVLDEYNGGISLRKSVYLPYPNAVPRKHLIDESSCLYLTKGSCRLCERVCPNQAIDFNQKVTYKDLYVGSIIVATGIDNFDPKPYPRFGAQYPNVIDQFQLARYLDGEGPTSGILTRPSDGKKPQKIVMVQCAGSRDPELNPYCSRYCCMAAMKHAQEIKVNQGGDIEITILFKDIRAGGKYYEEFYNRIKNLGINFIYGNFKEVKQSDDKLFVEYIDGQDKNNVLESDLVVLSTGMIPSRGTQELAEKLGLEIDKYGFFDEVDIKVASTITKNPGIFIAGACHAPKDIPESVAQASAAAAMVATYLMKEIDASKPILTPIVDPEVCGRCGVCVDLCPYNAISMPPEGPVVIDDILCQSCGLCISSCPTRALDNSNFGFDSLMDQVKAALKDNSEPKIIGFACNDCGYRLLDAAGFYNSKYSSAFIPIYVPCMSLVSLRHITSALDLGAKGVMLIGCLEDRCHYHKGVDHAETQLKILENIYKYFGRQMPIRVLKSCGSMLEQFLTELDSLTTEILEVKQ